MNIVWGFKPAVNPAAQVHVHMNTDGHRHEGTGVHTDVCTCTHIGMHTVRTGVPYKLEVTQNSALYTLFAYKIRFCMTCTVYRSHKTRFCIHFLYTNLLFCVTSHVCIQCAQPCANKAVHLCVHVRTHVRPLVHSVCSSVCSSVRN